MKIFYEPKVYLIAEPKIDWQNVQRFFSDLDNYGAENPQDAWMESGKSALYSQAKDADLLPEFCGRMCYCSFGAKQGKKDNESYIKNIVQMGHGSVLEHANFTFLVTQCSRGFTHELVRHRAGFAYSQESTHYIDYSSADKARMCMDERTQKLYLKDQNKAESHLMNCIEEYGNLHESLEAAGWPKKDVCSMARQLLPNALEAKIAFTANIRALRHVMVIRGANPSVLEIRKVFCQVFKILLEKAPASMYGLKLIINPEDNMEQVICEDGRKV